MHCSDFDGFICKKYLYLYTNKLFSKIFTQVSNDLLATLGNTEQACWHVYYYITHEDA